MNDSGKISDARFRSLADDLKGTEVHIPNHEDKTDIVGRVSGAVISQEITRMVATKSKMILEARSEIDKDRQIAYWRVLAYHYRGSKYQEIFEKGVGRLEKLTAEEARNLIHAIRSFIEPSLNREMEEKEISIGFELPLIGKFGLGNFRWRARGTRINVRRLQIRLVRIAGLSILWLSALLGTVHWIAWTMFNYPSLIQEFEGIAKGIMFVLLISITLALWILERSENPQPAEGGRHLARNIFRIAGYVLAIGGWIYWLAWVVLNLPLESQLLEPLLKMALPFYLTTTWIAAWVIGRILQPSDNSDSAE